MSGKGDKEASGNPFPLKDSNVPFVSTGVRPSRRTANHASTKIESPVTLKTRKGYVRHAFEKWQEKKNFNRKSIIGGWITMLGLVNLNSERCVIREVEPKEMRTRRRERNDCPRLIMCHPHPHPLPLAPRSPRHLCYVEAFRALFSLPVE